MKILTWFKNRKENKIKEKEEFFKKIKYRIDNSFEEKQTGTFDFNDIMSDIVEYKKGNYRIIVSTSFLNSSIRDLVFNMAFDYKLKEKVYNHIFRNSDGSENTFLSLLMNNVELLDDETKKYVLNGFPLKLYNTLLYAGTLKSGEQAKKSVINKLLKSLDNEFIVDLMKANNANEILNNESIITYSNESRSFLNELSVCIISNNYIYSESDKISYIISQMNEDTFKNKNNDKELILTFVSLKASDLLRILKNNLIITKEDLESIIPNLLKNYENTDDSSGKENILSLLKEMMSLKIDEEIDSHYFLLMPGLSKKTYNMWFDNFFKEKIKYPQIYGILKNHFDNTLYKNLNIFENYLGKVTDKDEKIEKELIDDIYGEIETRKLIFTLEKYINYYVDVKGYNLNKDCLWLIKHCESGIKLTEKEMFIFKKYGLDPFTNIVDDKNIFNTVNDEGKLAITQVYLKEKAEYEKNLLNKIVNIDKNDVIIKKRL